MDDVGETLPDAGLEGDEVLAAFEVEAVLVDTAKEGGEGGGDEEVLAKLLLELIEELRMVLDDEVVFFEPVTLAALPFVATWEADFEALLGLTIAFTLALEKGFVDLEPPTAGFGFPLPLPRIALRASRGSETSSSNTDSSAKDRQTQSPKRATSGRVRRILM